MNIVFLIVMFLAGRQIVPNSGYFPGVEYYLNPVLSDPGRKIFPPLSYDGKGCGKYFFLREASPNVVTGLQISLLEFTFSSVNPEGKAQENDIVLPPSDVTFVKDSRKEVPSAIYIPDKSTNFVPGHWFVRLLEEEKEKVEKCISPPKPVI